LLDFLLKRKFYCDGTSHSTRVTPIYLSIHGGWEIKHTIFEIRSFNKHAEDGFQILFSTKTNETLQGLPFVNRPEIFLEVHLKGLQ